MTTISNNASGLIRPLLTGNSWTGTAGAPASVHYAFASGTSATVKSAILSVFDTLSKEANVTFVQDARPSPFATPDAAVTLVRGNASTSDAAMVAANVVIGQDALTSGVNTHNQLGYDIVLHEVLHAMGMKHPGYYGPGDTPPYLSPQLDNRDATVMSDHFGSHTSASHAPSTPMTLDIAALQYLYGANHAYNAGNTAITFSNNGSVTTVWDGGGIDTLQVASNFTGNTTLDLREGPSYNSHLGTSDLWIAYGANIENATGGIGKDVLYGNALGNVLNGGGGNDAIYGFEGNDSIVGGVGKDVLYGNIGADTLSGGQDNDALYGGQGNDSLLGDAGADALLGCKGNDTLNGGDGNDTLIGGAGADVFVFLKSAIVGADTVEGFEQKVAGEYLDISSYHLAPTASFFSQIEYHGSTAIIHLVNETITVTGLTGHLAVDDLHF